MESKLIPILQEKSGEIFSLNEEFYSKIKERAILKVDRFLIESEKEDAKEIF